MQSRQFCGVGLDGLAHFQDRRQSDVLPANEDTDGFLNGGQAGPNDLGAAIAPGAGGDQAFDLKDAQGLAHRSTGKSGLAGQIALVGKSGPHTQAAIENLFAQAVSQYI